MPKNIFISYRRDDSKYQAREVRSGSVCLYSLI